MDIVRAGIRGLVLHPLAHGVLPAHHAVEVPVRHVVPQRCGLERIHHFRQMRPGYNAPVHALAHIGRADEQDPRLGRHLVEVLELLFYLLLIRLNVLGAVHHRHIVSTELEND